jgi:uncharacterized protein YecE (DUF72 family)
MRLRSGTSGFSYTEWKGSFYTDKTRPKEMLAFYAARLDCVEINNTFYRMPKPELFEGWAGTVAGDFLFALKATQRITHRKQLAGGEQSVAELWQVAQQLGPHLGPVLFQLPPYMEKDLAELRRFVASLPRGMRAVLEFRHASWFDEDVFDVLRAQRVALCCSDMDPSSPDDPGLEQPLLATADFGYVRLRRELYDDDALRRWIAQARAQPWRELFVFFKHEPTAPRYALALRSLWESAPPGQRPARGSTHGRVP